MNLILRPAHPSDLPSLAALIQQYQKRILNDYAVTTIEGLTHILTHEPIIVIDDGFGYAVGFVTCFPRVDDLHITANLYVWPRYFKRVLKMDMLTQAIDAVFTSFGVDKIKASAMDTQKGAIKLLQRYGFRQLSPLWKETRHNGKKVDVLPFELKKNFWNKRKETL